MRASQLKPAIACRHHETFPAEPRSITKASRATGSFLSAPSFREATKELTDAAIERRVDRIQGAYAPPRAR